MSFSLKVLEDPHGGVYMGFYKVISLGFTEVSVKPRTEVRGCKRPLS